jgi:hypothetical protein
MVLIKPIIPCLYVRKNNYAFTHKLLTKIRKHNYWYKNLLVNKNCLVYLSLPKNTGKFEKKLNTFKTVFNLKRAFIILAVSAGSVHPRTYHECLDGE